MYLWNFFNNWYLTLKKYDWWIDVYKYPISQEFGNNDQIEEYTTYFQLRYFDQIEQYLIFDCKESLVDLLARVSKLVIHEVDAALYTGHHRSRRAWKVFFALQYFRSSEEAEMYSRLKLTFKT